MELRPRSRDSVKRSRAHADGDGSGQGGRRPASGRCRRGRRAGANTARGDSSRDNSRRYQRVGARRPEAEAGRGNSGGGQRRQAAEVVEQHQYAGETARGKAESVHARMSSGHGERRRAWDGIYGDGFIGEAGGWERSSPRSRWHAWGRPEWSEQSSWAMAPATEVEEEDHGIDAVAIPADPLAYSM